MMIGQNHEQVVGNIKDAAEQRALHNKVEVDDPNLSSTERAALLDNYWQKRGSLGYSMRNFAARIITWTATRSLNRHTRIEGLAYLSDIQGGAVITSNHFSPFENTVVRKTIYRAFHQRIYIVSQDTNLAMTGIVGFLMNYCDVIPFNGGTKYIRTYFNPTLKELLARGEKILVYPEQEMWLNYRKHRPPKRGAYYYAALHAVPVISCFVEIKTLPKKESEEFYKTGYVMHILPPIWPDPEKTVRENSKEMMEIDYKQKTAAYEEAYGRPLTYDFEPGDVAGWMEDERLEQ